MKKVFILMGALILSILLFGIKQPQDSLTVIKGVGDGHNFCFIKGVGAGHNFSTDKGVGPGGNLYIINGVGDGHS